MGKSGHLIFNWKAVIEWGISALKRNTAKKLVVKLMFQASIYHIWSERNTRFHSQILRYADAVLQIVLHDVWLKIQRIPRVLALYSNLLVWIVFEILSDEDWSWRNLIFSYRWSWSFWQAWSFVASGLLWILLLLLLSLVVEYRFQWLLNGVFYGTLGSCCWLNWLCSSSYG